MFFSVHSPAVRILCSIGGTNAVGRVKSVRVNGELIPYVSKATVAGSYWQYDNADLVVDVEEKLLGFNLSRFPEIQALLKHSLNNHAANVSP